MLLGRGLRVRIMVLLSHRLVLNHLTATIKNVEEGILVVIARERGKVVEGDLGTIIESFRFEDEDDYEVKI